MIESGFTSVAEATRHHPTGILFQVVLALRLIDRFIFGAGNAAFRFDTRCPSYPSSCAARRL